MENGRYRVHFPQRPQGMRTGREIDSDATLYRHMNTVSSPRSPTTIWTQTCM